MESAETRQNTLDQTFQRRSQKAWPLEIFQFIFHYYLCLLCSQVTAQSPIVVDRVFDEATPLPFSLLPHFNSVFYCWKEIQKKPKGKKTNKMLKSTFWNWKILAYWNTGKYSRIFHRLHVCPSDGMFWWFWLLIVRKFHLQLLLRFLCLL